MEEKVFVLGVSHVGIKVIQEVHEVNETIEAIQECAVGEVGEIIVTGQSIKADDGLKEATAISV